MKVTIDIPNNTILCAFLNGVRVGDAGLEMFSFQLDGDDLVDGNTVKLPREVIDDGK
jgi:hypothetical protein